ncbi:major facilitator superfamily transporter [Fusarium oxysporum Fo47]|uniref:major facilitator superfamily transporter n=1 Tax=Fusarium oxysporum Fo47 TaxID=660027 RepID=UPI002869D5AA|nr:major facilitator superfamily transporter [Fusarium oxysporum Fo47]WJG35420.1 major facilitator superfamily transporter [Fusarium oxysporum Fo47]
MAAGQRSSQAGRQSQLSTISRGHSTARDDAQLGHELMNTRIQDTGSLPAEDRKTEESRYGWVIVVLVFLINAHTWGLIGSYSIFLAYYLHSGVLNDPNPLTLAFAAGLSFSTALLAAPLVTRLSPWIGTRPTVMIGVFIQAGGLIAASFSTKIWHLVLAQGLLFGAGVGLIVNVTVSIVPQWFVARRSFAVALTTAGSGTGGLIYSLSIQRMIDSLGVSWAFRILAFVSFVVNGSATLFLRDRNHALGSVHKGFNTGLFRRTDFCLFLAWGFFSQFGFGITIFSMSDFAQTMGFTSQQGSYASAAFNLSQAVGRPLIGLASDRFGRLNVAGISTLAASISTLLIWTLAGKSFAGTIVYTLFGAFASNMWTTVAPVAAEVVGLQTLPSALSIFWIVLVLPTTFAEPIAVSLKTEGTNAYLEVQLFVGFMYLAAFISMWLLRAYIFQQTTQTSSHREDSRSLNQTGYKERLEILYHRSFTLGKI